jgi:hypothetical protein
MSLSSGLSFRRYLDRILLSLLDILTEDFLSFPLSQQPNIEILPQNTPILRNSQYIINNYNKRTVAHLPLLT